MCAISASVKHPWTTIVDASLILERNVYDKHIYVYDANYVERPIFDIQINLSIKYDFLW